MPSDVEIEDRDDLDDDAENDVDEDDDDETPEPVAAKPQRPRARKPVIASAPAEVVGLSPFGAVPVGVTHWAARKNNVAGVPEWMGHIAPGENVREKDWPLAELSVKTLEERWGPGMYEISWVRPDGRGGRKVMRGGRSVEIVPVSVGKTVAPAGEIAASVLGPEMDRMLAMQRLIAGEADAKMTSVLQFAAALAGRSSGGFGAAELELVMRNNREATMAAMTGLVEPLKAELASLRRELDGDDDETPGIAGAAMTAAAPLLKGKSAWAQAANFASGNPELVKAAIPLIADVFGKLAAIVTPAPPPPPPRPQARVAVMPPPQPHPPSVEPVVPPPPPPVVAAPEPVAAAS